MTGKPEPSDPAGAAQETDTTLEGAAGAVSVEKANTAKKDTRIEAPPTECDEGEFATKLEWVEVDESCGLGFEQPEGARCHDETVEVEICLPNVCRTEPNVCEWQVFVAEAAGLGGASPANDLLCFESLDEACACLACCDGDELIRERGRTCCAASPS